MKITRESVQEAISLSAGILPKFTAVELAVVLGVPVVAALKAIQANRKLFKFDAERNILGLDATNAVQTMNSNEVWSWYLKNRLGGDDKKCLPLSDQNRLNGSVNSRVKWETTFAYSTATFASNEKTGADVTARVTSVYSADIAARLVRLGTIGGAGQIPDRYLFGVVVTEAEVAARRICGLALYTPEWAMEEMLTEVDWITIDIGPKPGVQWVSKDAMVRGLPVPDETEADSFGKADPPGGEVDPNAAILAAAAAAAAANAAAPAQPGSDKKVNRRTKEQLDAERSRWNTELIDLGVSPADAVKCFNIEKFKEAEEFYKAAKASALLAKTAAPPAGSVPLAAPEIPGQQELPGTAEARNAPPQSEAPMVVPPPTHSRAAMPTLAALEGVKDIKADIAAKAGMTPPPVAAAPPPAAQAVAQAPSVPVAPPIAAPQTPPPAGASASAEDLLNSLLKSTGQAQT